jgi:cytochrome c oxidase subunit 2
MTQASTGAHRADVIFLWILALSVVLLLGITATMVLFVIRYSRKRHPKAEQIHGNAILEVVWTVVPLAVFIGIFYFGWTNYEYEANAPADSMVVKVTGRQWTWSFEYPNKRQSAVLYAPVGRPMKLEVQSADVIHGFFIPAFRLKIDAVPGRTNTTWFQPTEPGTYDVECTVICGVDHSAMLAHVAVVPEDEFRRWYFGGEDAPPPRPVPAPVAAAPANEHPVMAVLRRHECLGCHSVDGRTGVGPTFLGMFGLKEEIVVDGRTRTVVVDEAHLRRSIQKPGLQRVKGYPGGVMPAANLEPAELDQMVDFLKGLKRP